MSATADEERREPTVRTTAVVVTFNRASSLERTLDALAHQSSPPTTICVVDNGDATQTARLLSRRFPGVQHLVMASNTGYAGGLAAGMRENVDTTDSFLLLDDDSQPGQQVLARLTRVLEERPSVGVVGTTGGTLRLGTPHSNRERWVEVSGGLRLRGVDYCMVDCALVTVEAVRRAGLPDPGLFMNFEDVDFTDRVRMAGFDIVVADGLIVNREHLGAASAWRAYYLTRNQLLVALDRRSPSRVLGWAYRTVKLTVGPFVRRSPRAASLARLRMKGVVDGLRGLRGPTLEPF